MLTTPHSPRLITTLTLSQAAADRQGLAQVGPEALLLGLLRAGKGSALRMLAACGVSPQDLEPALLAALVVLRPATGDSPATLSAEAENVLYIAGREARFWESEQVETMHLLLALLRDESSTVGRLLASHGVHYQFLFDMAAYDRVGLRMA